MSCVVTSHDEHKLNCSGLHDALVSVQHCTQKHMLAAVQVDSGLFGPTTCLFSEYNKQLCGTHHPCSVVVACVFVCPGQASFTAAPGSASTAPAGSCQAHDDAPTGAAAVAAGDAAVAGLCRHVQLEAAAWRQRMPLAAQVMHPSMQQRHLLMLLQLKHIAEGGNWWAEPAAAQQQGPWSDEVRAGELSVSSTIRPATPGWHQVQQDLLAYDLLRLDGYQNVFLPNSAANVNVDVNMIKSTAASEAVAAGPRCSGSRPETAAVSEASVAALLTWLGRNQATQELLGRVVSIAEGEQQLRLQVCMLQGYLSLPYGHH